MRVTTQPIRTGSNVQSPTARPIHVHVVGQSTAYGHNAYMGLCDTFRSGFRILRSRGVSRVSLQTRFPPKPLILAYKRSNISGLILNRPCSKPPILGNHVSGLVRYLNMGGLHMSGLVSLEHNHSYRYKVPCLKCPI